MPYVRRRGGSHVRLAQYVANVRAARNHGMSGRGMGQDDGSLDAGGFPIDTGNPIDTLPMLPIDTTPVLTLPPTPTGGIAPAPSSSTPFDWNKFLQTLTGGAAAGSQIYRSLQTPGLVPGTNAIFNPATGQFYNPLTGQVVNPVGVSPTSNVPLAGLTSSPFLLIGGVVVVGVVIVAMTRSKN